MISDRTLVLGIGCKKNTSPSLLHAAVLNALQLKKISPDEIKSLVTIDLKCAEPALLALAEFLKIPLKGFSAAELAAVVVPNPSVMPLKQVGTSSVAEAAALLESSGGDLILSKTKLERTVTIAVARK